MSKLTRIAEIPAGSWTKWVVVGFWLVVLVLALPLSSKLTGAQKNDTKYWLPGNAESTKVLDVQSRFQSPNVYAGVVVYVRPSGLTAADRAGVGSPGQPRASVSRSGRPQASSPDGQERPTPVCHRNRPRHIDRSPR